MSLWTVINVGATATGAMILGDWPIILEFQQRSVSPEALALRF